MRHSLVAAVDFGSYKLSASLGKDTDGELEILGSVCEKSKGIEKGLIIDENKCIESLKEVIKKLSDQMNKDIDRVYIGISSRNIRISEVSSSINLRDGIVRSSDIKRIIERCKRNTEIAKEEEIIDIAIDFYKLNGKIFYDNIIGLKGSTLELDATILITGKSEVDKYKRICRECGLTLSGFKVNILSGKSIFLSGKSSMGVKALVDIGASVSDIAIFRNGILKSISSVPLGGENITKDLAICASIPNLEAENIKNIYSSSYETIYKDKALDGEIIVGTTKINRELFYEVINARIEEIIKYVNLELNNTGYFEGICSIIIYGDGISCYENVNVVISKEVTMKFKVITGSDLGLRSTKNITSLAIVKEAYDRQKLTCDDFSILEEDFIQELKKDNKSNVNEKEESLGLMSKLKSFFEEIF